MRVKHIHNKKPLCLEHRTKYENTAVWTSKSEPEGVSALVREKCQGEKACGKKRQSNNNNNNKQGTDELCRRCGKESETIQHITAACEQLAPTEYVKRRDGLAKVFHQKLAEASELIKDKSPYYKYIPANVLENENFRAVLESQHTYGQNNTF